MDFLLSRLGVSVLGSIELVEEGYPDIGDLTRVQDPSVAEITRNRLHLSANGGGGPEEAFGSYRETPVV